MARFGRGFPSPNIRRRRQPFLLDNFSGAGDVVLASHVGEIGATWTVQPGAAGGVPDVSNDRLYAGTGEGHYYASGIPPTSDYTVSSLINVISLLGYMGVGARMDTAANTAYWAYVWNNTGTVGIYLDKYVGGSVTNLGSQTVTTPTVGTLHPLALKVFGSSITAYWDGVPVVGPITDSAIASGRAGIIEGGSSSPWNTLGFQMEQIQAA